MRGLNNSENKFSLQLHFNNKEKLQKSISKLTGRVAVLKFGRASEKEVSKLKGRINDILCATKLQSNKESFLRKSFFYISFLRIIQIDR